MTSLRRLFLYDKHLTGVIPDLTGLTNLEYLRLANNQLSGSIPAAPPSLAQGESSLCPNYLTPSIDPAWDVATGVTPWSAACTVQPPPTTSNYTVPFIPFSSVYYISEPNGIFGLRAEGSATC